MKMPLIMGNWSKVRAIKKIYGGGVAPSKVTNLVNVSDIIPQQSLTYLSFTKKAC